MTKTSVIFSVFILGGLIRAIGSNAADLNTPLDERPTMGGEIKRGYSAATDCMLENRDALQDGICIDRTSSTAEQARSNFKPFQLGLYFGEWWHEDMAARSAASLSGNVIAQASAPRHIRQASGAFAVFRRLESQLGITDAQLLAATTADMNALGKQMIADRLLFWEKDPPMLPD